jgi:hypothetical protein
VALGVIVTVMLATAMVVVFSVGAHNRVRDAWGVPGLVVFAIVVIVASMSCTAGTLWILRPGSDDAVPALIITVVVTGLTTAIVAIRVIVHLRPSGPRLSQMPYLQIGALLTCSVPVGLLVLFVASGIEGMVQFGRFILPIILFASLSLQADRRQMKGLADAQAVVEPGAVVYIRGFRRERARFGFVSMRHEDNEAVGIISNVNRFRRGGATFEEFFEPTVREQLGPWQGLGNPTDLLPPLGVVRLYIADRHWRENFAFLVKHSRCVLTFPRSYRQLRYELSVIRKADAHQRFFILIPPQRPGSARVIARDQAAQAAKWAVFAATAAVPHKDSGVLGLILGPYPGAGAVVTFDADTKAVVIHRDAKLPLDFVSTIQAHLDGGQKQPES